MEKFTVEKWHCREVFHCTKCPYTSWSREDVIAHYDSKHAPPVKRVGTEQATAVPVAEVEQEKCAECEKRAKKPRKRKSKKES